MCIRLVDGYLRDTGSQLLPSCRLGRDSLSACRKSKARTTAMV